MRGRAHSLVCGLLAGLMVSCGTPEPPAIDLPTQGRDLILITVDTLRADAVGAYERHASPSSTAATATPVIDALAARGRVYPQAFAPMPRTTPSLATLLSGRSPKHHGSREVGQAMSSDVPLLSQILRRPESFDPRDDPSDDASDAQRRTSTYLSVAVTGNRAAARPQGLHRGFDVFHVVPGDKPAAEDVTAAALQALEEALDETQQSGQSAQAQPQPLFLWVHYVDPHFPYEPPGAEQDACSEVIEVWEEHAAFVYGDQDGVSSRGFDDCVHRYRDEVARTDAEIGRLFDALRRLGRPPEESLVVFTSDHGENLGEDGLFFEHGPSLHDASLRVPLIIAGPGIPPNWDDFVVELQDVAPTVASLLGVRPESLPPMEGRDLSTCCLGRAGVRKAAAQRVALAESNSSLHIRSWDAVVAGRAEKHCVHHGRWSLCGSGDDLDAFRLFDHEADPMLEVDLTDEHPEVVERLRRQRQTWPPESARSRAVRNARFKLVEAPSAEGGYTRRLFDLSADPSESRDVAAAHPEVTEELGRQLDQFVSDLPVPGEVVRNDEDLEALRALGYVE